MKESFLANQVSTTSTLTKQSSTAASTTTQSSTTQSTTTVATTTQDQYYNQELHCTFETGTSCFLNDIQGDDFDWSTRQVGPDHNFVFSFLQIIYLV